MIADPARGAQGKVLPSLRHNKSTVRIVVQLDIRLQSLAIRHILDRQPSAGFEVDAMACRTRGDEREKTNRSSCGVFGPVLEELNGCVVAPDLNATCHIPATYDRDCSVRTVMRLDAAIAGRGDEHFV